MCGICGFAVQNGKDLTELSDKLDRMVCSLRHRGPDGWGQKIFPPLKQSYSVGLGHTRLSVLDLSSAGRQPMANDDESTWISYNGEVYNFLSHRRSSQQKGHRFHSQTDTEVLLYLYQEHGEDFLSMLNGMFSLAIFDRERHRLLLARDPLGIKPLYYYQNGSAFVFASEIKAILDSGYYTTEINWQSVYDYFTYLYVPSPQTIFRDIWQVPPGHSLIVELRTGETKLASFWQVRRLPEIETASRPELEDRTKYLLRQSVRQQLVSDVPLGVFLSGGIDSTIVAGLACEVNRNVKTFTIVFEGREFQYFNEQQVASAISRHLGTEHHEITVPAADLWPMLDLVNHFDQPFGNPTFYLMYLVSKYSRDEITVALCGAGGDELYAGYPRYRAVQLARQLDWVPARLWRLGGRALDVFHDKGSRPMLRRARQFISGMPLRNVDRFAHWTYFMDSAEKRHLLSGQRELSCQCSERVLNKAFDSSPLADVDNRLLHVDVGTFLVDNLLEYTDKMTMAVSLESRVPLLDQDFVEFSLNVPFQYKLGRRESKVLLRNVFSDFMPSEARKAPKKGFNAPLSQWMRNTLDDYFDGGQKSHVLAETLGRDVGITWGKERVLNRSYIEHLRQQHRKGKADYSYELFSIMIFDVWWRKYVCQSVSRSACSLHNDHERQLQLSDCIK
jgi:asparagine synthase (glutamine-hydrolysing)